MTVWREVQEALYGVWEAGWGNTTRWAPANESFDPMDQVHVRLRVQARPGRQETLGKPGNRKFARRGVLYAQVREPPGKGVGSLSDLAGKAKDLFEGRRFAPHDIRFAACDIGAEGEIDGGTWWGVTAECPFDYEEIK